MASQKQQLHAQVQKTSKHGNLLTTILKKQILQTAMTMQQELLENYESLNNPTLISSNGAEISSPAEKTTLLSEMFGKNFNTKLPPLTANDTISLEPNNCPENLLCSEDDILEIILSLDTNKASGLDDISARMLK